MKFIKRTGDQYLDYAVKNAPQPVVLYKKVSHGPPLAGELGRREALSAESRYRYFSSAKIPSLDV
jgi:hypothetical protein